MRFAQAGPVSLVCLACTASCAGEPPAPPPIMIPPAPVPTSKAGEVATAASHLPPVRRYVATTRHLPESIDDDTGPAPCDFARLYRSKIRSEQTFSVVLASDGHGALSGLFHDDRLGPAVPLTGKRRGERDFTFDLQGGGHFEGRCLDDGVLDGTRTLGKRKAPFSLAPRPAEWPPMFRVLRAARTEPHNPRCAREGKPDVVVELDAPEGRIFCMPTNAKAKKALMAEAPRMLCSAEDQQMRVFGLPDASIEARVNRILDGAWFDLSAKELKGCSGVLGLYHYEGLIAARRDLLVVSNFTSNDYGGAHPANSGGASVAIDLARGVEIHLPELADEPALRRIAVDCLSFHRATAEKKELAISTPLPPRACDDETGLGAILWGCEKDGLQQPVWTLMPEGIVLGAWANAHALAVMDGKGPVIPWSVLVREKALPVSSPVSRLWAGVAAAPKDALACPMSYWGETLDEWHEAP